MPVSKSVAVDPSTVPCGQNFERGGAIVAIDPPEHVPHGVIRNGRSMKESREERAGTLVPVALSHVCATHAACTDHRVRRHDCGIPFRRRCQR